ncbi:unnamed protein product [Pipistrellus nathusii]|uniref:Uncharacterized protein n=1 Tax=Pipistrellus nathusii TaxID=59473 RepID=A0ABP0A3W8_PIPNA
MLTKGDQNTGYQRLWFIFRGNLSSQEHQADSMPLGLILLENCQDCGLLATLSPHSRFQELHERFGKEIRALQVMRRGLQEASTNGGSRSQAKTEQELNRCLLMND